MIEEKNNNNGVKNYSILSFVAAGVFMIALVATYFMDFDFWNGSMKGEELNSTSEEWPQAVIAKIAEQEFALTVSKSFEDRARGLGGVSELPFGSGMIFIFDKSARWGIWMKDMLIPIDVLWLDENYRVVNIVENMDPGSYPETYVSEIPALYVIEVASGTVQTLQIKNGDAVSIVGR